MAVPASHVGIEYHVYGEIIVDFFSCIVRDLTRHVLRTMRAQIEIVLMFFDDNRIHKMARNSEKIYRRKIR